jgi:hypothetical protein
MWTITILIISTLASHFPANREFIRFSIDSKKIEILTGGSHAAAPDNLCNSLFVQQISHDTINYRKPLVDFGVELTCGGKLLEAEVLKLTQDTIRFPKEFYMENFNFTPLFINYHKPWPKLMYIFDGQSDLTSFGNYAKGYIKFSKITKASKNRYFCTGTFDFTYKHPSSRKITRIENGEFSLLMNYY